MGATHERWVTYEGIPRKIIWTSEGRRWVMVDEDAYTEDDQFADWVDKMIRAEEADGEVERPDRSGEAAGC